MAKREIWELQSMQAAPLSVKISLTKDRIREWVNEYGEDGVYVSFSGGKDSTVLLTIAREMYPSIKGVYVDTGLEYPEIREFVKTWDNIEWLKPKMNFRQVIEKYGYPMISKEVSECVAGARKYLTALFESEKLERTNERTNEQLPYYYFYNKLCGLGEYKKDPQVNKQLIEKAIDNVRVQRLIGILPKSGKATLETIPSKKNKSAYSCERYQFFLNAPFNISNQCCNVMKKSPAHKYAKETGRKPMTAQMASESRLRTQQWLKNGCNGFNMKQPMSNPMTFWTDQDVLLYIKLNKDKIINIRKDAFIKNHSTMTNEELEQVFNSGEWGAICSVYGDIIDEKDKEVTVDQSELGLFDRNVPLLKTTGCSRTGCVFCGFGCHLEKPEDGRFLRLKNTHPKIYEYIMKPWKDGGLGYTTIIDWINEHGHFNIKY